MLLHYGTKQRLERFGQVAEFCPICRDVVAFEAFSLKQTTFVQLLPAWTTESTLIACHDCGSLLVGPRGAYQRFLRSPEDMEDLVEATNPTIFEDKARRLELEDRLADGRAIGPDDRIRLIAEPMIALEIGVVLSLRDSTLDAIKSLVACGFIASVVAAVILFVAPTPYWVKGLSTGIAAMFTVAIAYMMIGQYGRWARKHALPRIAGSLSFVRPTDQEIKRTLEELRRAGKPSGRWYSARGIARAIDDYLTAEEVVCARFEAELSGRGASH